MVENRFSTDALRVKQFFAASSRLRNSPLFQNNSWDHPLDLLERIVDSYFISLLMRRLSASDSLCCGVCFRTKTAKTAVLMVAVVSIISSLGPLA